MTTGDRARFICMRKLITTLAVTLAVVFPASAGAGQTYMTVKDAHRALASHLPTIRKELRTKRAWVDNCQRVNNFNVTCDVVNKWSAEESPTGEIIEVRTLYFLTGGNCRSILVENQADGTPSVRKNVCPKK